MKILVSPSHWSEICLLITFTLQTRRDFLSFTAASTPYWGCPVFLHKLASALASIWTPLPFGTQWGEGLPSPLAGSKLSPSSPSVTYRKVTANIWILPNLIRASSESTRVAAGGESVVLRRGRQLSSPTTCGNSFTESSRQYLFHATTLPREAHRPNFEYTNSKSSFSDLLLFLWYSFPRPTPLSASPSSLFFLKSPYSPWSWNSMNGMFWFTTAPLNSTSLNQLISAHSDNRRVGDGLRGVRAQWWEVRV